MKALEALNARVDEQQWRVRQSLEKMVSTACASIADSLNRRISGLEQTGSGWESLKEVVSNLEASMAADMDARHERREMESAALWQSLVKAQDELSRQSKSQEQSVQDLWASLGEVSCKVTDVHQKLDESGGVCSSTGPGKSAENTT